jgi:hypothetical protein
MAGSGGFVGESSYMKYSGDTFVISCPYCGQPAHYSGLASSNSFGGKAWTDGYCFYSMSNNCSSYTRCFACKDIYSIRDAKRIGMMSITDFVDDSLDIPDEVWSKSRPIAEPSDQDMYNSLQKGLLSNEKEVRILAWWRSNDKFRYLLKDETDEEVFADSSRQLNLEETLCLMGSGNAIESLMKAELFRQSKRFDEAIEMVSSINDCETLSAKIEKIKSLAERSDYMVRRFD